MNKEKVEKFDDINAKQWKMINDDLQGAYVDKYKIIRKKTEDRNNPAFLPKLMIPDVLTAGHNNLCKSQRNTWDDGKDK